MATKTKVTGMKQALAISKMLAVLTAVKGSAEFLDDGRDPYPGVSATNTPNTFEIIEHLAKGNTKSANQFKRDIRPTPQEINEIAADFLADLTKAMRKVRAFPSAETKRIEKHSKAAIVKALRSSAKDTAAIMYNHVKNQTTQTGQAQKVSQDDNGKYAKWRNETFGISDNVVFVASKQLSENLQKGNIKINIDFKGLSKALSKIKS